MADIFDAPATQGDIFDAPSQPAPAPQSQAQPGILPGQAPGVNSLNYNLASTKDVAPKLFQGLQPTAVNPNFFQEQSAGRQALGGLLQPFTGTAAALESAAGNQQAAENSYLFGAKTNPGVVQGVSNMVGSLPNMFTGPLGVANAGVNTAMNTAMADQQRVLQGGVGTQADPHILAKSLLAGGVDAVMTKIYQSGMTGGISKIGAGQLTKLLPALADIPAAAPLISRLATGALTAGDQQALHNIIENPTDTSKWLQGTAGAAAIGATMEAGGGVAHDIFGPKTGSPAETPGARPPAAPVSAEGVKQAETPVAPTPAAEPVAQTIKDLKTRLNEAKAQVAADQGISEKKAPPPDLSQATFQSPQEATREQPVPPEGQAEAKRVWDSTKGQFVAERRASDQPVAQEHRLNVAELPHEFLAPKDLFSKSQEKPASPVEPGATKAPEAIPQQPSFFDRIKGESGSLPLPSKEEVTGPGSIFHEEVKPAAAAVKSTFQKIGELVKSAFPVETGAGNKKTTTLFRSNINERANELSATRREFSKHIDAIDKLPAEARRQLMVDMYRANPSSDPNLREFQDRVYELNNQRREEFAARGHEGAKEAWEKQHFSMQWIPNEAEANKMLAMINRPGKLTKAGSLKGRTLEDIEQGFEKGLVPADDNAARMFLNRYAEQGRFLAGFDSLHAMHEGGNLHVTQNDVKGMTDVTRVLTPETKSMLLSGKDTDEPWKFFTDDASARIIRNIVTPSAVAGNPVFEVARAAKNFASQVLLGWSGVHMGNTVFNDISSDVSEAMPKAVGGGGDLKKLLQTGPDLVGNVSKGKSIQERMLNIGNQAGLDQDVIDTMKRSTQAEVHQDHLTNFRDRFSHALEGTGTAFAEGKGVLGVQKVMRALGYAPLAASEKVMSDGIFKYVNHTKLSYIYDQLAKWRGENPNAHPTEMQTEGNRIADHADDVFGQMNHDNLMWNRTARDLLQLGMLSTTWNFGTGRLIWNSLTSRKGAAALMGMAATHAMYGTMKTYLNTGQGPQSLKDYLFPPTGEKDKNGTALRERPPGYMADIYEFMHHPGDTLMGKTGPIGTWAQEVFGNQFHDGSEIISNKNTFSQNLANISKAIVEPAHPAVAQNLQRALARGDGTPFDRTIGVAASLFERRAPMEYNRSDAQNKAIELRRKVEEAPDELDHSRIVAGFADSVRAGHKDVWSQIDAAQERGVITQDDREAIVKLAQKPTGLEGTLLSHGLKAKDIMGVWDVMTPEERKETEAIVRRRIADSKDPKQHEYFQKINSDMKD